MIGWFEKNYKVSWIISLVIASIIFYVSTIQFGSGGGGGGSLKARYYHLGVFFILCLFLCFSIVRGKSLNKIIFPVVLAGLYGISDEVHQFFVPGRSMSLGDVILDCIGVGAAAIIYIISVKYRER